MNFKVGDRVEIIAHNWKDGTPVSDLQYVVGKNATVLEESAEYKDYIQVHVDGEEEGDEWGIRPEDLRLVGSTTEEKKLKVSTQKTIRLTEDGITLTFTTNTKKQKVSISTRNGSSSVRLDQVDGLLELIGKLKLAIDLAV